MKLTDLDAEFLKVKSDNLYERVELLEQADGVIFQCPQCFKAKGNGIGVHSIICWQPKVAQTVNPKPGRWNFVGKSLEDLTLVMGSSSVRIEGACNAHFFVRNGEIIFC